LSDQCKDIFVLTLFGVGGYLLYGGIFRLMNRVIDVSRKMSRTNAEHKPKELKFPHGAEIEFIETEQRS